MSGAWKELLILLSCVCCAGAALPDFNPHTPIQQTWQVLGEEGNIVWATTAVHPRGLGGLTSHLIFVS